MPTQSAALESVQGLGDDKDVSFSVAKFGSSSDVYFLLRERFEICVPNVRTPYMFLIELGNEGE